MYDGGCVWNSEKNNMQRLLYVMEAVENMDNLEPSVAHYLMQWNGNLQKSIHNLSSINTFLNKMNVHTSGNLVVPISEIEEQGIEQYISTDAAMHTANVAVNIALIDDDLTSEEKAIPEIIYNVITVPGEENLDKDKWNYFWRLFNLLNLGDNAVMKSDLINKATGNVDKDVDIDGILQYYPGVEDIARYMLEHHVAINPEGGFSLMKDEEVVANAMLGSSELKIAVDPFDEDSKEEFEKAGYKVVAADDLKTIKTIIK